MHLLLINRNPAVSRLINLSAKKYGHEIEEFESDDFDLDKNYDVTIIDNEALDEESISSLKESGVLGRIIYVSPKNSKKPSFADYLLQKPFLPTDFIDMVKKIDNLNSKENQDIEEQSGMDMDENEIKSEKDEDVMALDLDEMDSLDISIPDSDFQEHDIDEDEDEKIQLDDEYVEKESIDEGLDDFGDEDDLEDDNLSDEDIPEELRLEEDTDTQENEVAVLDSEDIDEVKLLLDDDVSSEGDTKEELEEEESFDSAESLINETNIESAIEDIEDDDSLMEGLIQEEEELQEPAEILEEIDKLDIDNELEEDADAQNMPDSEPEKEEDIDMKEIFEDQPSSKDKLSIDELSEDDLSGLFGDEIQKGQSEDVEVDIDSIKEELQTKIVGDVKEALDKDEIREALKGLKVNISISFDEE